jgi:hypothetical protein
MHGLCTRRKGRSERTLSVYIDPKVYGFTGGSTRELRGRWFNKKKMEDYDKCQFIITMCIR